MPTTSAATSRSQRLPRSAWALVLPFSVLFVVVYLLPLGYSVYRSLFSVQRSGLGLGAAEVVFSGLSNYATVLTSGTFWSGMARVGLYGLIQIPVMLLFAIVLALLLDSAPARAVGLFRLTHFLPYAVPGIVAALLWAYLYVPALSPVVQSMQDLGWHVNLLGADMIVLSMANISVWAWTGYNMLIYLSALQAVPQELYEAARLDGAGEWRVARSIKLPLIRGSLGLTVLISIIGTIQLFSEPTILGTVTTAVNADYVPMMMAYNVTFGANNIELGSAISVVITLVAGVLATVHYRLSSRSAR